MKENIMDRESIPFYSCLALVVVSLCAFLVSAVTGISFLVAFLFLAMMASALLLVPAVNEKIKQWAKKIKQWTEVNEEEVKEIWRWVDENKKQEAIRRQEKTLEAVRRIEALESAVQQKKAVAVEKQSSVTTGSIEIIIDGISKTVTKQELFGLVTSGKVSADTPVNVNGKLVTVETAVTMDSNEAIRSREPTPQGTTNTNSDDMPRWVRNLIIGTAGLIVFVLGIAWQINGCNVSNENYRREMDYQRHRQNLDEMKERMNRRMIEEGIRR